MTSEELPGDVAGVLTSFDNLTEELETALTPLTELLQDEDAVSELSPLDAAHAQVTLAYAINSLFYMYLRTQGVDASQHPVREELERVKKAYVKLLGVMEPAGGDTDGGKEGAAARMRRADPRKAKLDMAAGSRFIAANLSVDKKLKKDIRKSGAELEATRKNKKKKR